MDQAIEGVVQGDLMAETTYSEEKQGRLGFMVIYQTIDGRMEIEYFDFYTEALKLCKHLRIIGRNPKVWREIEWQS